MTRDSSNNVKYSREDKTKQRDDKIDDLLTDLNAAVEEVAEARRSQHERVVELARRVRQIADRLANLLMED